MYSSKTPIDQVNSTRRQIRTDAKNSLQLEGADREAPSGVWGSRDHARSLEDRYHPSEACVEPRRLFMSSPGSLTGREPVGGQSGRWNALLTVAEEYRGRPSLPLTSMRGSPHPSVDFSPPPPSRLGNNIIGFTTTV